MNKKDFGKLLNELSEDLRKSISDAKQELTKARTTASANLRSLEEKDKNASNKLSDFDQKASELNEHIAKAHQSLNEINTIKDAALHPETGIRQDLDKISSTKEQTATLRQEVSDLRDLVKKYETEIAAAVSETEKSKKTAEQAQEKSTAIVEEIEKIYQLATDTGLAGSFDQRKKQLEPDVKYWRLTFLVLTLVLALASLGFAFTHSEVNGLLVARVTFFTPLLGLIIYSAFQHSKERKLLEKYAFKSATALALHSYTELLTNRFKNPKSDDPILLFVLRAMQNIYKEPHEETKRYSAKLDLSSQLGGLKASLEEELVEIKESVQRIESQRKGDAATKNSPETTE